MTPDEILDLLDRANRSGIAPPTFVEPPRSIGDLIDRFGDDLYLCFNLTAIGAEQ
jgi:hypothetical protein